MKNKGDEIRLHHILEAINNIGTFSTGKTKDDLYNNPMFRYSVERQLEIIGEAAKNLSEVLQQQYSFIPWPQIISFRNFLAHEYFGLDLELIWDILSNHIPALKTDIEKILNDITTE